MTKALQSTFDRVYTTLRWTDAGNGSGPGSDIEAARHMTAGLLGFVQSHKIRSIRDVSCGGMAWWPGVLNQLPGVNFVGADVSKVVTDRNRARFANHTDWCFVSQDARDSIPARADLIVCRQTLNHLWASDACDVVRNLLPMCRYLALTQDGRLYENPLDGVRTPLFEDNADATRYTPLNLRLRPFFLPQPIVQIGDVDGQTLAIFQGGDHCD